MTKSEKQVLFHKAFKLQGKSFASVEEIIDFSKNISSEVCSFFKEWFSNTSFVEVKTSGSTGDPKLIRLKKKQMKNSALATGTFFNLQENTTALLCMSPNYIAGKMMLVRALELGWIIDVVEPTSNPLKNTENHYDFSAMVPIQLHNSLDEIYKIKKLIVGGGIVSKDLLLKIQTVKTEIFATYGMTETITHIAVKKLNNYEITERSRSDKNKKKMISTFLNHSNIPESHYEVLPNVKIAKDSRNCLVINAPKVADDTIITNDVVELISSTEFEWLGRYDSIINSGGIKLIPEQIENKLSQIIKERFFVYGLPDAILGEKLVLIIERLVMEQSRSDQDDLLQKIKQLKPLSKYELPKEIYFLNAFVETETQKINRSKTVGLLTIN